MIKTKPKETSAVRIALFALFILLSNMVSAQTITEALKLTENEQYEAAGEIYKKLIAATPTNPDLYYYLGENYLLAEDADSALIIFKQGDKVAPNNPLITIGLAKYDLDKFNLAEAKRMSEMVQKDFQKQIDKITKDAASTGGPDRQVIDQMNVKLRESIARYQETQALVTAAKAKIEGAVAGTMQKNAQVLIEAADALLHFKNKDYDKAKTYLDKAYELQPKNAEVLIFFGDLYAELNNGSLSADYYNKALNLNPTSPRSIVNKGRLYKRSTNYDGASEEFKRAIGIDNNFAPAHRELGDVYFRLNKLDLAKAEYKKYLELSKNNCAARIKYASFLYYSKDFSGTLNELGQLKNCDPNNLTMLRLKAWSAYELKDSVKSLAAMKEFFARVHEDRIISQDYEYYGKSLIANNEDSLGVEQLRKAYSVDNTRCDLLNEIYNSFKKQKRWTEAAAIKAEKIAKCKGATTRDYLEWGSTLRQSGDFEHADSAFAKVTQASPTYEGGWYFRGLVNESIDSTKEKKGLANPFYEKFIEVFNADTSSKKVASWKEFLIPAYRYLAVWAFNIEKNTSKTVEFYKKILDLDPEDKNASDAIRGIEFEREQRLKKKP